MKKGAVTRSYLAFIECCEQVETACDCREEFSSSVWKSSCRSLFSCLFLRCQRCDDFIDFAVDFCAQCREYGGERRFLYPVGVLQIIFERAYVGGSPSLCVMLPPCGQVP